jgi:hypothetical protein
MRVKGQQRAGEGDGTPLTPSSAYPPTPLPLHSFHGQHAFGLHEARPVQAHRRGGHRQAREPDSEHIHHARARAQSESRVRVVLCVWSWLRLRSNPKFGEGMAGARGGVGAWPRHRHPLKTLTLTFFIPSMFRPQGRSRRATRTRCTSTSCTRIRSSLITSSRP